MSTSQPVSFEQLNKRIEQGHRKALVRAFALSLVTVAVAASFLFFTLTELKHANQQLQAVKVASERAQADLKSAHEAAESAERRAALLHEQVTLLEGQLAESKKALADALDLGKYVHKLDWYELKMMNMDDASVAYILEVILQLKNQVHWGMDNTPAGGYNSPGFANLVLHRLHHSDLASLSHDAGSPAPGDIVVYESGYHLFYFRDHEKRRQFVVGMTPLGVLSLDYDFGVKRTAILRTDFHR